MAQMEMALRRQLERKKTHRRRESASRFIFALPYGSDRRLMDPKTALKCEPFLWSWERRES